MIELNKLKVSGPIVLYHANCVDGFGSAYIAWTYFGDEATYLAVSYGEPAPYNLCSGKDVLLLDFCYTSAELILLANTAKSLTVLDHHKTSLHELQVAKHLTSGDFDYSWHSELSGVGITWNTFYPGIKLPQMLAAIQDRDLWQFAFHNTRFINAALFNTELNPRTFKHWHWLISDMDAIEELIHEGEVLVLDMESRCKQLLKNACKISLPYRDDDGALAKIKGIAINATADYASELGNLACTELECNYTAIWFVTSDMQVQVSLRSIEDFDVSAIAKHHGGGGHKNAAGFRVPIEEFVLWLGQNPK